MPTTKTICPTGRGTSPSKINMGENGVHRIRLGHVADDAKRLRDVENKSYLSMTQFYGELLREVISARLKRASAGGAPATARPKPRKAITRARTPARKKAARRKR